MDTNTLVALAEPNRLRILELLKEKPRSVNEVARALKIRQPQTSKHLRTLTAAGLVESHPIAQQRIYTLNPKPLIDLESWLQSFNVFWNNQFEALDAHIETLRRH